MKSGFIVILLVIELFAQQSNQKLPSENIFVELNLKLYLEGPFDKGIMHTTLNSLGLIPLNQPYSDPAWNYTGNEHVNSIPPDVVDWVLIELRQDTSPSSVVAERACFILNSGNIVDLDGISKVRFNNVKPDYYYIIVKHRNHLPVMSSEKIYLSDSSPVFDFSVDNSKAYGNSALVKVSNNLFALPAGNGNYDNVINILDYKCVVDEMETKGYKIGDYDLNGIVNNSDYAKTANNLFKLSFLPTE